ncbi:hypothetical protein Efla_005547 [Eimeria flavescens]
MLKKISTFAGGGHHSRRSSSCCEDQRRRSLDEGRLGRSFQHSDGGGEGGQNNEADDLRNALEMLTAENKHLKALIQERDSTRKSSDPVDHSHGTVYWRQRTAGKETTFCGSIGLRCMNAVLSSRGDVDDEELQRLRNKVSSLEAQLQFECRSHATELQEKEARVAELEMLLLDAQRKSPSPHGTPQSPCVSLSKSNGSVFCVFRRRKEEELEKGRDKLHASQTDKDAADRGRVQAEAAEFEQRERDLQRRINILELKLGEAERQRAEAEEALSLQAKTSAGDEGVEKVVDDLRKEIQEKDKALNGMSQQLLEVSAEKDELAQELQALREASSAPGTPRVLTSKRSFFGRSKSIASERDALVQQVHQLETQLQQLTERRVGLERTKVKLEGQLAEAAQDLRVARSEKAAVEDRLREREAALESLRSAQADISKPLATPVNLSLPKPKGRQDAEYELKTNLVLKEGVIKSLSSRLAHLQFALSEAAAEKEKLMQQPATVALRQQLEETNRELAETLAKYRDAVSQRTELRGKVKDLTEEVGEAHREMQVMREALEEAQLRLTTTADKYKEQSERYRGIVSSSLSKIEELQDEVMRERNSKLLVGKMYRQEMLELRHAAVAVGGVRGDPVRPLSSRGREAAANEKQNEGQQLVQQVELSRPAAAASEGRPSIIEQKPLPSSLLQASQPQQPLALRHPLITPGGQCPFSLGIPTAVNENAATISLCCPLDSPPRQPVADALYAGTPSHANVTDDQRRAAEILQAYVKEQQHGQQHRRRAPPPPLEPPSRFASPSSSGTVGVEAPFSPQTMGDLQQPPAKSRPRQSAAASSPSRISGQELSDLPQQSEQRQDPEQPPPQQQAAQRAPEQQQQEVPTSPGILPTGGKTERKASGTRVLQQQWGQADASSSSALEDLQPADNLPLFEDRRAAKSESVDASGGLQGSSSASLNSSAALGEADEDALGFPCAPPSRIDEKVVVRDLHVLQQKRRVLFSGSSASLVVSEGDDPVDLS